MLPQSKYLPEKLCAINLFFSLINDWIASVIWNSPPLPGFCVINLEKIVLNMLREIFQKNGGNLGTQGSAAHNFKQVGIRRVDSEQIDDENALEIAINSGADECFSNKSYHEIHCNKEDIYDVKKILEKKINNFLSTNIEWYPLNKVKLNKEQFLESQKFLETLEDHDDVQKVYSNIEMLE